MSKINHSLVDARRCKKVTQEDLADYLGISRTGYRMKETGVYEFTESEISKICKLLEVSPMEIFFKEVV